VKKEPISGFYRFDDSNDEVRWRVRVGSEHVDFVLMPAKGKTSKDILSTLSGVRVEESLPPENKEVGK